MQFSDALKWQMGGGGNFLLSDLVTVLAGTNGLDCWDGNCVTLESKDDPVAKR